MCQGGRKRRSLATVASSAALRVALGVVALGRAGEEHPVGLAPGGLQGPALRSRAPRPCPDEPAFPPALESLYLPSLALRVDPVDP